MNFNCILQLSVQDNSHLEVVYNISLSLTYNMQACFFHQFHFHKNRNKFNNKKPKMNDLKFDKNLSNL